MASGTALRNMILVLLVGQTVLIVLLMRYSRTIERPSSDGPMYKTSVAVFLAEAFKLPVCLAMTAWVAGGLAQTRALLSEELFGDRTMDTLKCSVPALCYTVQNNLLFVALSNLDPPTYQVCYQMKTITTAGFAYLLLSKTLSLSQWVAVVMLALGAVLVSDLRAGTSGGSESDAAARTVGLGAVFTAAALSGFSAAYLEALLKKPAVAGLWVRNIQLSLFALPLAGLTMVWQDRTFLIEYGMLQGVGALEWSIVVVNGAGGLLIAAVMKYADAIVKCFANALAIVLGALLSVPLFGFQMNGTFLAGGAFTVVATSLYAWAPQWQLKARKADDEQQEDVKPAASEEMKLLISSEGRKSTRGSPPGHKVQPFDSLSSILRVQPQTPTRHVCPSRPGCVF